MHAPYYAAAGMDLGLLRATYSFNGYSNQTGGSMISTTCASLLSASAQYHPLYQRGLSNHLPMALIALDAMGASPAQLERFASHYAPRLVLREAIRPELSPSAELGKFDSFEGVHTYFVRTLERLGTEEVLHTWIPRLIPGLSASAFHALIRLAYGIEAQHAGEVATALAYWVIEYRTLGELGDTIEANLQHIAATALVAIQDQQWRGRLIIDRMVEVATHPSLRNMPLQPEHLDSIAVAHFALEQYVAREDFTLLHLVTGCHAFRLVEAYSGDTAHAARYLWQAVLFANLTVPPTEAAAAMPPSPETDWQQCLQRASASLDDHVIKLVFTAWREFSRTRDLRYQHIAARKTATAA
jgi:hypothetical protein